MTYPLTIRRCQHIKVNGVQCGSPALRNERRCYYHHECHRMGDQIHLNFNENGLLKLPTLEDANSIQLGLARVMRLLASEVIDHRTASLFLRALRTAANNVKYLSLEPKPTRVVIDPDSVENRPLGSTAWSATEGRDYDEEKGESAEEAATRKKAQEAKNKLEEKTKEAKKKEEEQERSQRRSQIRRPQLHGRPDASLHRRPPRSQFPRPARINTRNREPGTGN